MKYLCLGYYNERIFAALSESEVNSIVSQCPRFDEALRNTRRVLVHGSLAGTEMTKSIRPKGNDTLVTDGPFAETKEQIGTFFVIEAQDMDEAITIASNHPAAHLGETVGWGLEIRPIEQDDIFDTGANS